MSHFAQESMLFFSLNLKYKSTCTCILDESCLQIMVFWGMIMHTQIQFSGVMHTQIQFYGG